jgi:MFS family permease
MSATSASMPYGQPHSSGLLGYLGHRAVYLLAVIVAVAIALRVYPIPPENPLSVLAPVGLMGLVIWCWVLMRRHDHGLCEGCLTSMPLNPSLDAARYAHRLATAHLGANRPLVVGYLAVLIGSAFVPGPVGLVVWSLAQSTMIYLLLSYTTHRRLQPWCPACKGGGSERDTVPPNPSPQGLQNA